MLAERLAMEEAVDAVAQMAVRDASLLTGSDPMTSVAPSLENLGHTSVVQVGAVLLQRFHDTARAMVALETLVAATEQILLPAFRKLEECIGKHRAFQSAYSLTPLLQRSVTVAAQCCALAIRDTNAAKAGVVLPLAALARTLGETISEAVVDRADRFRPIDASRLTIAHQNFAQHQFELSQAWASITLVQEGVDDTSADTVVVADPLAVQRPLAPPLKRIAYTWRNEEFGRFWAAKCVARYDDSPVPTDILAVLLLKAADQETTLGGREALMRRLGRLCPEGGVAAVAAKDLDNCGPEMRRCGGLKAWVAALIQSGGTEAVPSRSSRAPLPGSGRPLASTWGGPATYASSERASSLHFRSTGAGVDARGMSVTAPLSARSTMSSITTKERRPFLLSASLRSNRRGLSNSGAVSVAGATGADTSINASLFDSVERNNLSATQRLVFGDGMSVNARSCSGFCETALHAAASRDAKHAPHATLLLERGADANAEDRNLATPLHVAASVGHREVAKKLLKSGALVCKGDRWSATPLHKAADNGQAAMVEMLLLDGANAGAADDWGATPLHRAVTRGHLHVAEHLLSNGGFSANTEDRRGERPIHVAAARGDYALVKLLLEHGVDASARSRLTNKTPEDFARERGHVDIVTLLSHREDWIMPRVRLASAGNTGDVLSSALVHAVRA